MIDKITILEIKSERITDPEKLVNVRAELDILSEVQVESIANAPAEFVRLKNQLRSVNEQLWSIEDQIRVKERNSVFDVEFVELARNVYKTNDQRADIKRKINELLGSKIKEEKSYQNY